VKPQLVPIVKGLYFALGFSTGFMFIPAGAVLFFTGGRPHWSGDLTVDLLFGSALPIAIIGSIVGLYSRRRSEVWLKETSSILGKGAIIGFVLFIVVATVFWILLAIEIGTMQPPFDGWR